MPLYSKVKLSSSALGKQIPITSTSLATAQTVHSTLTTSTTEDEVWIYAANATVSSILLTISFGGALADEIKLSIPSQAGLTLVIPGLILLGNGTVATNVTAYSSVVTGIFLSGYVNRIT